MATLAQLGISIDSGPAKTAGAEVRKEFKEIGADARTMAAAVDKAAGSVNRLGTATTTSATTAATNVARLVTEARSFETSVQRTRASAEQWGRAVEQVVRESSALVPALRGMQGGVGNVAGAMGAAAVAGGGLRAAMAALGGPVGVAAVAFSALPAVLQLFHTDAAQAKKDTDALRDALERLSPAALKAAEATFLAQKDRIRSTPMTAGARATALAGVDAQLQPIQSAIGKVQTDAALQFDAALKQARASSVEAAEALRLLTTSGEKNAEVFKRASAQWVDSSGKARSLLEALREGDANAIAFTRTIDGAVRSERAYADHVKATAEALRDRAKATKEAKEAAELEARILSDLFDARKKWSEQLAKSGQKDDEQARKEIARNEERRQQAQATADDIITAQTRQLQAMGKSESAVQAMTRAWAEQDLIQKLVAAGLDVLSAIDMAGRWRKNAEAIDRANASLKAHEQQIARLGEGAAQIAAMTRAAAGLASAFGGVGQAIGGALDHAGGLLDALSSAQRAGIYRDASGKSANVGFSGALSGAAGIAGVAAASSATLGVVGAVAGIAQALKGFGDSSRRAAEQAEQAAIAFAEVRAALKKSVDSYALAAGGTSLDKTLAGLKDGFDGLIRDLLVAGAPRVERLGDRTAKSIAPTADDVNKVIDAYEKQVAAAKAAAAEAARWADITLSAREAAARGDAQAAEQLRQQITDEKELADARREGADAATLVRIATLQAAEAQQREAERLRQQVYASLDADQRRNRLSGNDRAAFEIGARATRDTALDEANNLFKAGKISADTLATLTDVINNEFNQALADFTVAAERAKRAQIDDLAVRALVATGNNKAAEQARRDIANRKELEGVTDANIIAQIKYVQGLEAEAAAKADLIDTQNTWLSINEQMANAYRDIDSAKAKELDEQNKQARRDAQINAAKDEVFKQAYRDLYALEDLAEGYREAAKAAQAAAEAVQAQARASQELANVAVSITDEFLRATGQGFEADRQALGRRRDERLGQIGTNLNAAAGPAPTINPADPLSYIAFAHWQQKYTALQADATRLMDMVNATYDANLQKLIADQMKGDALTMSSGAASASASSAAATRFSGTDTGTVLGGDSVTFRGGNSITETSGMRLIDYAASQTALLRRLVELAEGRQGGTSDLLPSLARQLDRQYGRRIADQMITVFGEIA